MRLLTIQAGEFHLEVPFTEAGLKLAMDFLEVLVDFVDVEEVEGP